MGSRPYFLKRACRREDSVVVFGCSAVDVVIKVFFFSICGESETDVNRAHCAHTEGPLDSSCFFLFSTSFLLGGIYSVYLVTEFPPSISIHRVSAPLSLTTGTY